MINLTAIRTEQMNKATITIAIIEKAKPASKAPCIDPQPERKHTPDKPNNGNINFFMGIILDKNILSKSIPVCLQTLFCNYKLKNTGE